MQGFFTGFYDPFVTDKNQGGKDSKDTDQADNNALGQRKAHIRTKLKAHEAQAEQTGKGGQGTAGDSREGGGNSRLHGGRIICAFLFFLGIAVQQDDGVIHGKNQLQNAYDGVGILGNTRKKYIGSQIDGNSDTDVHHEDDRFKPGIAHQQQKHKHQADRNDHDIQRQHGNVGLVNGSACGDSTAVIKIMYGPEESGCFL